MPTELPKNIIKLAIALLKHQAENVLGKDAIGIAGDALVDIGGEKIQGKIDAILNTNEGSQKLVDAALRADTHFRKKCTDQDLRDAFTISMGDLPSVQTMLKDLPYALDYDDALKTLRENLSGTFPRLKEEQIEYGVTLYLESLNRALLPLKDFALSIIGMAVLESKADIKEIKVLVKEVLHRVSPIPVTISEIEPPLPEFDQTFLERLDAPGGALKISDPFYIERDADNIVKQNIIKNGSTITIRASHQTGKSSLLARGLHHAGLGANIIHMSLQSFERGELEVADSFYKHFARVVVKKLKIDPAVVDSIWQRNIAPLGKLNELMEDYVLGEINHQAILAVDEADRLIRAPFRNDFFGLLRTWHNNRSVDDSWNKLNLILIISTEPNALINSRDQSPFNVGEKIFLADFSYEQVYRLNKLHGLPIKNTDFDAFFELLNGHPFLTREALYLLVNKRWTFDSLVKNAAQDDGPFGEHLINQFRVLTDDKQLRGSFAEIVVQNRRYDKNGISRLLQAGLIMGRGESYNCRCGLYKQYFIGRFR